LDKLNEKFRDGGLEFVIIELDNVLRKIVPFSDGSWKKGLMRETTAFESYYGGLMNSINKSQFLCS